MLEVYLISITKSGLKCVNLKIPMLRLFADRLFRPAYNSTHNSLPTYASFRRYTLLNIVYPQHGDVYYCRQNNITVTLCTGALWIAHSHNIPNSLGTLCLMVYIQVCV